jgi:hypothetical protein
MKRILSSAFLLLMVAPRLMAQTSPDANVLTQLLKEFLNGASRNDANVHDRFWAPDLIYTRSSGLRIGKADVMRNVRSAPARRPGDPTTMYSAEDIRIQQYGNTAVVAFRLVGATERSGRTEVTDYLNTGAFLKRDGVWQVVSWQATKIPRPEDESRKEVATYQAALHQALLTADVKALDSLMDETFIWTHRTGEQVTRQQLFDQLTSGKLKYKKIETNSVTVSLYGDAAVVRGVSTRQRSSIPGQTGAGDASPFTAFYTLTFVNKDGGWKAVAMHTSRPN